MGGWGSLKHVSTVMVTTQEGPPVRPDGLADPLYSRQVGSKIHFRYKKKRLSSDSLLSGELYNSVPS